MLYPTDQTSSEDVEAVLEALESEDPEVRVSYDYCDCGEIRVVTADGSEFVLTVRVEA